MNIQKTPVLSTILPPSTHGKIALQVVVFYYFCFEYIFLSGANYKFPKR